MKQTKNSGWKINEMKTKTEKLKQNNLSSKKMSHKFKKKLGCK